jgi:hypothetical protein
LDQQDTGINRYSRNKQNKNRVWSLVSRGDKTFEVPQKKVLNGHDFYLIFTGDTKNKAKKIATKQHKIGFHTRVIEIYPTVWAVYRRNIIPYLNA